MKKITGTIKNDWLSKDGFNLYFEAVVIADHYYIPAKKYLPNGDVGYPAEGETEIKKIDFETFEIWDDGYQLSEDFVKAHPEYKDFCKKWILENEEEIKWDLEVVA